MSWGEARGTDGEGGWNVGPPREVLLGIHIGHAFLSSVWEKSLLSENCTQEVVQVLDT
jgi:hypothetical protein